MDLGLRDRACIVTGSTSGIGRVTAELLAAEGAALLLVGRRAQMLAEVAEACRAAGGTADTLALDVLATDAGERALQACMTRYDRLDVLVNNAGATTARPLEQLRDEDWQQQWDMHVMAPMRLMRAAAPVMADRGWGRIVNVSSSSGKRPSKTNMAYSVTKAAALSLSQIVTQGVACSSTRSRQDRWVARCGSRLAGSPTRSPRCRAAPASRCSNGPHKASLSAGSPASTRSRA